MINILSYVGMNMHSEVCLWTLLGLVRTIFDATLFKVNANLKQVWQMSMPDDLSMSVQRVLRTMISGVMLVQCFTVYVYLASYIVLLYPVFLEERPTLVLPWLLLAATRKLLCELTSLALGLGTCVLLGPARPPCIKFVVVKLVSITPAFYVWMLVLSYYHALKVAAAFKTYTAVLPPNDHDYGLELAIRRRRTKSLLGEEQLRTKIVASLYGDRPSEKKSHPNIVMSFGNISNDSNEEIKTNAEIMLNPTSTISHHVSETGSYEDWYGSDVVAHRNADRIIEQIVIMMLRIGAYLSKEGVTSIDSDIVRRKSSHIVELPRAECQKCSTMPSDDTDTPPFVGSSKENTASYVREYPQIFMKRPSDLPRHSESKIASAKTVHIQENVGNVKTRRRSVTISPNERGGLDVERNINKRVMLREKISQLNISSSNSKSASKETNTNQKQTALKTLPQAKTKHEVELDKLLSSSDSLRSLLLHGSKNKNNSNEENEDATASEKHKHKKKE